MFYNADSGLYLANYRTFDPIAGRSLGRDPVGEGTDLASNLYVYAGGNPVSVTDPTGQFGFLAYAGAGAIGGTIGNIASQLYYKGCVNLGEVADAAIGGAELGADVGLISAIFKRAFACWPHEERKA